MRAALPPDEDERLKALYAYNILDTPAEQAYDDIVQLASLICGTPIAVMTLIDKDRQWFKSIVGLDAKETPREVAFCSHAILNPAQVLVVPDATQDKRFSDNPLVTGEPGIRFYAGSPLLSHEGHPLGVLCVIDRKPMILSDDKIQALRILSRHISVQMELTRRMNDLARFQKLSVGREMDMIRMKTEINDLLIANGKSPRYEVGRKAA